MKRTLLFLALFSAVGLIFGQSLNIKKDNLKEAFAPNQTISEQVIQKANPQPYNAPEPPDQIDGNRSIILIEIGGAANGFGFLGQRQYLWADDNINAVSFVHRMLAAPNGPGSGYLAYDYSIDGGETFTVNNQVYDPTLPEGWDARYPQGGFYNPEGNTDPTNAAFGYFAATLDASNGDTWGGYAFGTQQFASTTAPIQHNLATEGDFLQGVPSAYTITSQGLAIGADPAKLESYLDYTDNMIVTSGHYNAETGEFEMERKIVEMPGGNISPLGVLANVADAKVAFSPDGMIGFIGYLSNNDENDDNSDGCYYPILYKTIDGGESWDGPYNVQLGGDDGIPAILNFITDGILEQFYEPPIPDREDIPFTSAFEFGMTVDYAGNPHLTFDVGIGSQEWSIYTSYGGNTGCMGCVALMHVFSLDGGENWIGDTLCTLKTFRGEFPYTGGTPVAEDNRPYAASTMDGTRLFFSWIDTDIPGIGDNISPDIFCIGYNANNNSYSEKNNVTFLTNAMWQSYMGCGSKYVFDHGDGTYTVPFVYQEMNPEDLIEPVQFWYIDNFVLTDADIAFTIGINETQLSHLRVSQNFPNPCSDITRVSLYVDNPAKVSYDISNLLGQKVWVAEPLTAGQGNHILPFDVSELNTGVYLYNVHMNGETHTGKMLVK
nr:T9SS type A sorting domain-containing protein [Bacteroidota bacterium]